MGWLVCWRSSPCTSVARVASRIAYANSRSTPVPLAIFWVVEWVPNPQSDTQSVVQYHKGNQHHLAMRIVRKSTYTGTAQLPPPSQGLAVPLAALCSFEIVANKSLASTGLRSQSLMNGMHLASAAGKACPPCKETTAVDSTSHSQPLKSRVPLHVLATHPCVLLEVRSQFGRQGVHSNSPKCPKFFSAQELLLGEANHGLTRGLSSAQLEV